MATSCHPSKPPKAACCTMHPNSIIVLLLLLLHCAAAQTFTCPCTLTLSVSRRSLRQSHKPFYLLIRHTRTTRRSFSISQATHSDALFHHFHAISIPYSGTVHLSLEHPSRPFYHLQLRDPAFRQVQCPIVLKPDPPTIRQIVKSTTSPPTTPPTPHLTGANFVSPALIPYLVSIINIDATLCSGTVISDRWIISAAHCSIDDTSIVFIRSSQALIGGKPVAVAEVIRHPMFLDETPTDFYDIAVVKIAESALALGAKAMPINFRPQNLKPSAFVRALGYGDISARSVLFDTRPFALRQVDIPIVKFYKCQQLYLLSKTVLSRRFQFCAGYVPEGQCDTCNGDSGGPLIQYQGSQPVLVGVISAGVECGQRGIPGVNINVAAHKGWLNSIDAVFEPSKISLDKVRRNCAPGKFLRSINGAVAICANCPPSTVSPGGASRSCLPCPRGSSTDTGNPSVCTCRAVRGKGFMTTDGDSCQDCPLGSFSPFGSNFCKPCREGTFSDRIASFRCKLCPGVPAGAKACPSSR